MRVWLSQFTAYKPDFNRNYALQNIRRSCIKVNIWSGKYLGSSPDVTQMRQGEIDKNMNYVHLLQVLGGYSGGRCSQKQVHHRYPSWLTQPIPWVLSGIGISLLTTLIVVPVQPGGNLIFLTEKSQVVGKKSKGSPKAERIPFPQERLFVPTASDPTPGRRRRRL